MAPRKKLETDTEATPDEARPAEFERNAPAEGADAAPPRGPANPPEPAEPMAQPEPQVGAVNPPEPEPVENPVDNRTRDGVQVPVNPEDSEPSEGDSE